MKQLWKIRTWFAGEHGRQPSLHNYYYAADSFDAALEAHRKKYSHGQVTLTERIGDVNLVGGGAANGE